ncbi:hypothetical protein RRF57_006733 [Xylaria bambusicola]|uniref:Uncharacterized protein n=1 Tax=Xylaria bambusicola TaxID=326684 RepID=A0AAN7UJS3_9PEZI
MFTEFSVPIQRAAGCCCFYLYMLSRWRPQAVGHTDADLFSSNAMRSRLHYTGLETGLDRTQSVWRPKM